MSGPATATSYEESVGSCGPPTPHTPPPSAAPRSAPVRRQLDFTGGGDLEDDDDDEFLCSMVGDIERGYSKAKGRAPPCVCGRGACAVEWDDQSGRWKYVCPSRPKCNHVAICEEVDISHKSQLTSWSHPKPTNRYAFNDPSNHVASPRTPVNVHPEVTVAITPVNVCPQVVGGTTLFSDNPQGAGMTTLGNVSQHGEGTATPANDDSLVVDTTTPAKFIPQGAAPRTPFKVTPQGARSNDKPPVCQCTAGTCKKIKIGEEDWYICPIPKGKGACSYRVLVDDFKAMITSAQATPCDEVHPECPSMLHRPIAAVNTPSKSPMRPYGTPSPISPNSNNTCFACKETGHWMKDCPKQRRSDDECFNCGVVGHWRRDCPKL